MSISFDGGELLSNSFSLVSLEEYLEIALVVLLFFFLLNISVFDGN